MKPAKPHDKLGDLLRFWRQQRGRSQLDLALDAGISQRHLSFVESGRSHPSRELLHLLARSLNMPLHECNALFLAAEFAPPYQDDALESPSMAPILRAIDRVLLQQEPYPALLLDQHWTVLRTNDAAPLLFGSLVDLTRWPKPRNLLHLVFSPHGLRPAIHNWSEVASGLLQRVQREALGHVLDDHTRDLLASIRQYPGVETLALTDAPQSPVIPISFEHADHRSSWFSFVSTVGTPLSVTAQGLRIECMFPAK